jgi:hypothetical protein
VDGNTVGVVLDVSMVREVSPQWRVFRVADTWWAVRPGVEKWHGPESLRLRTIAAPDLTALADRLCFMDWLETLDDDALGRVYRGEVLEGAS